MRTLTTAGLGLTLGLWIGLTRASADEFDWRPTSVPPAVRAAREVAASTAPAASLGRPIVVSSPAAEPRPATVRLGAPTGVDEPVVQVSASSPPTLRAQAPDAPPPPPGGGAVPPPPGGAIPGSELYNNGAVTPGGGGGNWFNDGWGHFKDSCHRRCGQPFQSDHSGDLDQFVSPVSSPFLTEDPRSLTEVKPLFIYQSIPNNNPLLHGGSIEYFGVQARLALTECWSIVLNKFGGLAVQPTENFDNDTRFGEIWIGPKFTFLHDGTNNTVAAVGLMFQIPNSSNKFFQDNGSLSIAPYFSFAKSFGRLPQGFGNFNYMSTTGFVFGDRDRSDYFYSNFHLDFDVGGQHKLYPLMELNYIRYVNKGHGPALPFEGGDLINFGSSDLQKRNFVTFATGARYKLSECVQFGGAVEFPLTSDRGLEDFRIVLDVIFRY